MAPAASPKTGAQKTPQGVQGAGRTEVIPSGTLNVPATQVRPLHPLSGLPNPSPSGAGSPGATRSLDLG
jgi:hypothetical protein